MREVVKNGTARGADVPGLNVCGKTGTAEASGGNKDQSWFICFAPLENPKIAMVVTGEGQGFGASFAVPIARKLLELYFNRTWPADVPRDSVWKKKPGSTPQQAAPNDEQPQTQGPFAQAPRPKPTAVIPTPTALVTASSARR
jgi:membrane peptidoglycan carboxypeptidase